MDPPKSQYENLSSDPLSKKSGRTSPCALEDGRQTATPPLPSGVCSEFGGIVGRGPALAAILRQVDLVAKTDSVVLIQGETGTGKELIARAIHRRSGRAGAFVSINVAAIPPGLWESEVFGHERGAFTGAIARRVGRLEQAEGGTLFLDEIGELDTGLQPQLLRVLQEREFQRVGGRETHAWNARLVSATNRDLHSLVDAGQFRLDLYYRLKVYLIQVPPLRQRREDIPWLTSHFVQTIARRLGKPVPEVPADTLSALCRHDWPGNVRELQNVIECALIDGHGDVLRVQLDPRDGSERSYERANDTLREVERAHILRVLEQSHWVIGGPLGAAARLGLKRTTLNHRLRKLGIRRTAPDATA